VVQCGYMPYGFSEEYVGRAIAANGGASTDVLGDDLRLLDAVNSADDFSLIARRLSDGRLSPEMTEGMRVFGPELRAMRKVNLRELKERVGKKMVIFIKES